MDCSPPGSSVHGIRHKNTGVGCHALLQGIFPTQGLNLCLLCLLHWQAGSLPLTPHDIDYNYLHKVKKLGSYIKLKIKQKQKYKWDITFNHLYQGGTGLWTKLFA